MSRNEHVFVLCLPGNSGVATQSTGLCARWLDAGGQISPTPASGYTPEALADVKAEDASGRTHEWLDRYLAEKGSP